MDARTNRLLWLLLAAFVVMISATAIIDRVRHCGTPQASAGSSSTAGKGSGSGAKVGNRIGFEAPDFTLPTIENREMKLSDYRGKPVVLNFWATWCGPCRLEVPAFKDFRERYPENDVAVIAVNTQDNPESASAYAKSDGLEFVIPVDPRGGVAALYGIRGMPTTFFIDEQGVIRSIKIGPFINVDEIEERMASLK